MQRRQAQRGVTLVEIMVVIAIVAILGMLGLGSMKGDGPTASNVSEQVVSTMSFARMRANAMRRIHRVVVKPTSLTVYQLSVTGLAIPSTPVWQLVQETTISKQIKIWNAQAGALVSPGATPSENASLVYNIDFRPDGRATASTVFITNTAQSSKYRVLVYGATGGSYARESW